MVLPGPPVVGYNNDCGTAEGVDPTPPTGPGCTSLRASYAVSGFNSAPVLYQMSGRGLYQTITHTFFRYLPMRALREDRYLHSIWGYSQLCVSPVLMCGYGGTRQYERGRKVVYPPLSSYTHSLRRAVPTLAMLLAGECWILT